jgi:phosphotransferase system HPr-like phosphotransfer protein
MGLASYEIVGDAREWQNVYETKEAAFEAAVAAASLALRQGHEVRITAPGRDTATGAADTG